MLTQVNPLHSLFSIRQQNSFIVIYKILWKLTKDKMNRRFLLYLKPPHQVCTLVTSTCLITIDTSHGKYLIFLNIHVLAVTPWFIFSVWSADLWDALPSVSITVPAARWTSSGSHDQHTSSLSCSTLMGTISSTFAPALFYLQCSSPDAIPRLSTSDISSQNEDE